MKDIVKLLRVHHYVKNFLVLVPLFFAGNIFNVELVIDAIWGFVSFCVISSAVYILNDIKDVEKDRNHPIKKNRPIASGKVSKRVAIFLFVTCILIAIIINIIKMQWLGLIVLFIYLLINIIYSCGLKNYPIIDIVILTAGFVLRIVYGGLITNIEISKWLYLVVIVGALFMGLGKRRNELERTNNTRKVLKFYTRSFLDKNMYVCLSLSIVFYTMWCIDILQPAGIWTVPLLIIIMMKYSLDVEGESDGDPIEVIVHDKILIALVLLFAIILFMLIYVFG